MEVTARNWEELMSWLYKDSWNEDLGRHRSKVVFRGVADCRKSLEPGLLQIGQHYAEVETLLLKDFRQYARSDAAPGDSFWNWLAVAQHHGLPTRLLDWTYSPFVALHFATANLGSSAPVTDGVIWMVNYGETNKRLSGKLAKALRENKKDVFSVDILDRTVPTLDAFDSISAKEFVVFMEPPSLDARIINQVALFSVMSRPKRNTGQKPLILKLDELLERVAQGRDQGGPVLYRKILIPADLKWEIRDKLDQANVSERVLFPGLDGLAMWLRRHYAKKT